MEKNSFYTFDHVSDWTENKNKTFINISSTCYIDAYTRLYVLMDLRKTK